MNNKTELERIERLERSFNGLKNSLITVYQRLDEALNAVDDIAADIPSIQELIRKDLETLKTLKDLY